ncbi:MAG: flippase-like domain-containing protein [Victivallales bacterium]|nr:flippase-like domain-containing protein [Victivallales bacterium]
MGNQITNKFAEQKKRSTIKNLFYFSLRVIIAGSIIYWLISSHYKDFIKVIQHIEPFWLIIAGFLNLIIYLASALRWFLLLKVQKIRITFFEAFSLTMQGIFFSLVIPGGALGGDLVKTGFLLSRTPKGHKLEATSTIFMDRFLGMFGQFSIGIVMAVFCIPLIRRLDYAIEVTVLIIIMLSVAGLLAGIAIINHRKLEKIKLYNWCVKVGNKLTKGYVDKIAQILDVYKDAHKTLFKCILIGTVFIQLNMALILFFISKGIHSSTTAIKPFILGISLGNTAGLLPITPCGLGTRDAVVKAILSGGGFSPGDSVAIPLLFSTFLILFSLFGGLFFVFKKNNTAKN